MNPEIVFKNSEGFVVNSAKEVGFNPLDFQLENPFFAVNAKKRRKVHEKSADFVELHSKFEPFIRRSIQSLIRDSGVFPFSQIKVDEGDLKKRCELETNLVQLCSDFEGSLPKYQDYDIQELELCDPKNGVKELAGQHISTKSKCLLTHSKRTYVLPPNSSFCISSFHPYLSDWLSSMDAFDLIVADPPWPNTSASRSSSYLQMDIYDLFQIPIKTCLSENGYMCIWVTNNPKISKFVTTKLFPSWGLKVVSTWYWIKVANSGELIFDLESIHRKPYEVLYVGCRNENKGIPTEISLVSVPGSHSRKPPLRELFKLLPLPSESRNLELFARLVRQDFTCWGNEAIKFNDFKFYSKDDSLAKLL